MIFSGIWGLVYAITRPTDIHFVVSCINTLSTAQIKYNEMSDWQWIMNWKECGRNLGDGGEKQKKRQPGYPVCRSRVELKSTEVISWANLPDSSYLFIYGLFNDDVSNSLSTASSGRAIKELLIT
jgi:hypothetical protein